LAIFFITSLNKYRVDQRLGLKSLFSNGPKCWKDILISGLETIEDAEGMLHLCLDVKTRRELPPAARLVPREGVLSSALLAAPLLTALLPATLLTAALLFTLTAFAFLSFAVLVLSALLSGSV
jgi:hypothetical protein